MSNYEQQANDFLAATNTTFKTKFLRYGTFFTDEKECRDIFSCTLKNASHRFAFKFGQSLKDSRQGGNIKPTSYDVLSGLTKYDVGTFDDFCGDFGYDIDSRKAYKTYKAVLREWKNIELLFTTEQIEQLQEIN